MNIPVDSLSENTARPDEGGYIHTLTVPYSVVHIFKETRVKRAFTKVSLCFGQEAIVYSLLIKHIQ